MSINKNIPLDFNSIENLFEINPREIFKLLLRSESIILYDTNSFAFHCNKKSRYYALDFFSSKDVVVFIHPILREMNYKESKKFPPWYLDYFKELRKKVTAFIFLDEREYINLLKIGKPSLKNIEVRIKEAFLSAFQQNKAIEKEIQHLNPKDKNFLDKLFTIINRKDNDKNRGEVGLFVAVQILCSLKEKANYKIFSDDYKAFPYMRGLTNILDKYYEKANIAYLSTVRNIQVLGDNLKLDNEGILEYLNNMEREKDAKLFIKKLPYDTCKRVVKSNEELAENIFKREVEILF